MENFTDTKILLVEDTPSILRALEIQLEKVGYSYLSAHNGKDALEILKTEENIGLIISDWVMPIMDGYELLKEVKKEEKYQNVPFLMLTVKESGEDATNALEAGAIDYVRKPYKPAELVARIGNLLKNWKISETLKKEATHDGLTGIYNHKYFKDCFKAEVNRVKRYGGDLSLILFDIDHFKNFNDQHGHQIGDFILSHLSKFVLRNIRSVDLLCRYGGEEFALILPSTNIEGAEILAGRLQNKIEQAIFESNNVEFEITCSFGVTCWSNQKDTVESLIKEVDEALYQSKNEGRNRVSICPQKQRLYERLPSLSCG